MYFFIFNLTESRQTAEDVVQEVFIKLWIQRNALPDMENFQGWMHRVAYNQAINGLKRLAVEANAKAGLGSEQTSEQYGTDAELIRRDTERWLLKAVDLLPPQQKLIYKLSREEGFKYDEIALKLSLSPLTVKKHMAQALKFLRKELDRKNSTGSELTAILAVTFHLLK